MGLDIEKVAMLTSMVDKLIQMKRVDNALDESVVEDLIQKSLFILTAMMRLQQSNGTSLINTRYRHILVKVFWQITNRQTGMTTGKRKYSRTSGHGTRII